MLVAMIFRVLMPLVILLAALVSYRFIWAKVLKPILDKEQMDGAGSNRQSRQQPSQPDGEQHDTKK